MAELLHHIPLNKQNANAIGGLYVSRMAYEESVEHSSLLSAHRDDYFILMILLKGNGTMRCDMETIQLRAKSILLIRPYQVHAASRITKDAEGYFISAAPFLIPDLCSSIFQSLSVPLQYQQLSATTAKGLVPTCDLLCRAFNEESGHRAFIAHHLFSALVYRTAALFSDPEKDPGRAGNQSHLITRQFRQLVSEHSFLHAPSFFAGKLNITASYLNDCVKATTGLSVTSCLQEAMLLEAKRHLYYTNDDVKKIAFTLGFGDHAYFSRLFKKLTSETPLAFRKKFRE